ncbi:MAG: (d)CMP kinase [Taibaiella sp.]|nr:(d)CMP kinase [Taibaiella sp.]
MKINIAIDGFSSCGKSTLARQLAERLGYTYIDSGAMYRAITLYFIRESVNMEDIREVQHALDHIHLEFVRDEGGPDILLLNGENVGQYIRDLIVADKVSLVAAIKEVRTFAVTQQQLLGKHKGVVMDGRDIGTVVFPDAELKIFVTADPEIRVKRRYLELVASDPAVQIEDVKSNLELRDYIDSNRKESPLTKAEDARILDNSDLSKEQQLKIVLGWVEEEVSRSNAVTNP